METPEIRRYATFFYKELFKREYVEDLELAESFYAGLPQVDADTNAVLDAELSLNELYTALMSLGNGKAPGIDGLPVEFYKSFWSVVGEDLLEVLRDSLCKGHLPLSCRRAVITLLLKKGDLQDLKNWRPPVVHGGRLDAPCWAGSGVAEVFCRAGILTVGSVVNIAGPELDNAAALAASLGVRSVRIISKLLSVRLVDGTSLCSGRLEVKSNQSWSSVCEADFDQQDAEVVCRELGCGAPLVLQGALYGEAEAPMRTKEFQCEGNESVLLDCGSSGSARNTCSPGKAVGLTCSEPDDVRLVGGASRCAGGLEMKHHGDWRPVDDWSSEWNLTSAAVVCRQLDCGSAVSTERRENSSWRSVWLITSSCLQSGSTLRECVLTWSLSSSRSLQITCSESVRLVDGTSLCSGRLEVKSNQSWSSVCEADFDQQDAEVVCRELGCGAPLVLQGALYGEVEAPMRTKEFQCEGSESVLLDCGSSGSARNTCSPGKAVGLTCSAGDVRLVGGASRCAGGLEVKQHGDWKPVLDWGSEWSLNLQITCSGNTINDINYDSNVSSLFLPLSQ
ncbi:CD5 antigen-like [Centroberyx affinis]|uniref:CD5 antigen-like n=1 Tax=Centroberyx affinis TaxID=166261 RepID=UPI003A5C4064